MTGALPAAQLGEFALQPQQGEVRAVFAPLRRLQRDLAVPDRVNTILVGRSGVRPPAAKSALRDAVTLDDLSVKVSAVAGGEAVIVESAGGVANDALEQAALGAARDLGRRLMPVFTYLANTIRVRDRQVPYSLVSRPQSARAAGLQRRAGWTRPGSDRVSRTGVRHGSDPFRPWRAASRPAAADGIVLNDWTARELGARSGDPVTLEFYLWDAAAGLRTATADFTLAGIVPIAGVAADPRLAPEYPGITQTESLADWDPPFPLDLSRVRPQDERYWDDHRTTPKAFLHYERARELWATRYGNATGFRFAVRPGEDAAQLAEALQQNLKQRLAPESQGVTVTSVRALALGASSGATDFGEYFTYFSFFIVVSALLLVVLFFRLGIEQRLRQIGILRATGYTQRHLQWMFSGEAIAVSLAGGLLGIAGALAYARVRDLRPQDMVGGSGRDHAARDAHHAGQPADRVCRRRGRVADLCRAVAAFGVATKPAVAPGRPFARAAGRGPEAGAAQRAARRVLRDRRPCADGARVRQPQCASRCLLRRERRAAGGVSLRRWPAGSAPATQTHQRTRRTGPSRASDFAAPPSGRPAACSRRR